MSLFNDNITNELEYIRLAKRYITEQIKCTVYDYVESEFNNIITNHDSSFIDEETEMHALQQKLIYKWIYGGGRILLGEFHINATETIVQPTSTEGYKYEVVLNVRLDPYTDDEYIHLITVPIMTDLDCQKRDPSSEIMKKALGRIKNYKPKIV